MSDEKPSQSYHEKRSESFVMVSFPVEIDGVKTFENMHAARCREKSCVLENSPFYAYGVSAGDRLAVDEIDGRLVFSRVLERGGHSTYRMKLAVGKNHEFFLRHWPLLGALTKDRPLRSDYCTRSICHKASTCMLCMLPCRPVKTMAYGNSKKRIIASLKSILLEIFFEGQYSG